MKATNEFELLVVRYLDGVATRTEVVALDRRLRASAEARRCFLQYSQLATALQDTLPTAAKRNASKRLPWILVAGIAGCAAVVLIGLALVGDRNPGSSESIASTPVSAEPLELAAISDAPPAFANWTLFQFALFAESLDWGGVLRAPLPDLVTLNPEQFWSADLNTLPPTTTNLTIELP